MLHNKYILSFIAVFLIHVCADASQKRSRENDSLVTSMPTKRQKVVCPKGIAIEPQRYKGMFYCGKDSNCSYVTSNIIKINQHHERHGVPSSVACEKCDFLAGSLHGLSNHKSKWHVSSKAIREEYVNPVVKKPMSFQTISSSSEDLVLPINEKKECGYCGREGNNMQRHMEIYHTPRFGKRSYFQCFSLYRNVPHEALPVSSDSNLGTEWD